MNHSGTIKTDLSRPLTLVLHSVHHGQPDLWCWGKSTTILFWGCALIVYSIQILCHSTEKNYILTNLPWLVGSLGTMAEDVVIFVQFRLYAIRDPPSIAVSWIGEWLAAVLENRLFRLGPGCLPYFSFSFRYVKKVLEFKKLRKMWLMLQKFALYSGHGMVFGRFFPTYGCTWANQREHDPGMCMEYGSTDIQDQNAHGIFLFMVTWRTWPKNWATKLDRRLQRGIQRLNIPPRKEQNKSKTFLLFFKHFYCRNPSVIRIITSVTT